MEIVRFLGGICLTLKGFCQEINGEIFAFWHFSVTYNVSFTKIICISLPHRLKVFFLHFSWNSVFLHLKKNTYHQANCNILLPVCFKHPILQII